MVTCISEQTVQTTSQAVRDEVLHDALVSALSHFDQATVTFSEGIV
jgi:hypothetical protein